MKAKDIRIRDPFILPVPSTRTYYLYGTTDPDPWIGRGQGFDVYTSDNLEDWEGPVQAFTPPADFWATKHFWAPEVHLWRGAYYMLASFCAEGCHRGVQILRSSFPQGPFTPVTRFPVTPPLWDCLDGTLFIDDEGSPWLVFSHEWTQAHDGEVCAMRLGDTLEHAISAPSTLFRASESGWSIACTGEEFSAPGDNYVTDGPFLFRTAAGTLLCVWSSFSQGGYSMGLALSASGQIEGPWRHHPEPLFRRNGGHGMLFSTFANEMLLALHQPNESPLERLTLLPVVEEQGLLRIL